MRVRAGLQLWGLDRRRRHGTCRHGAACAQGGGVLSGRVLTVRGSCPRERVGTCRHQRKGGGGYECTASPSGEVEQVHGGQGGACDPHCSDFGGYHAFPLVLQPLRVALQNEVCTPRVSEASALVSWAGAGHVAGKCTLATQGAGTGCLRGRTRRAVRVSTRSPDASVRQHRGHGGLWDRAPRHCRSGAADGGPHASHTRGRGTANTVKRPQQQSAQPPTHQLLGAADAQTAHPAASSTAPTHQLLGSANAETTPAGAPAAAADRTQRPDATCEGRPGDCPGPRKEAATRRHVTRGGGEAGDFRSFSQFSAISLRACRCRVCPLCRGVALGGFGGFGCDTAISAQFSATFPTFPRKFSQLNSTLPDRNPPAHPSAPAQGQ